VLTDDFRPVSEAICRKRDRWEGDGRGREVGKKGEEGEGRKSSLFE